MFWDFLGWKSITCIFSPLDHYYHGINNIYVKFVPLVPGGLILIYCAWRSTRYCISCAAGLVLPQVYYEAPLVSGIWKLPVVCGIFRIFSTHTAPAPQRLSFSVGARESFSTLLSSKFYDSICWWSENQAMDPQKFFQVAVWLLPSDGSNEQRRILMWPAFSNLLSNFS